MRPPVKHSCLSLRLEYRFQDRTRYQLRALDSFNRRMFVENKSNCLLVSLSISMRRIGSSSVSLLIIDCATFKTFFKHAVWLYETFQNTIGVPFYVNRYLTSKTLRDITTQQRQLSGHQHSLILIEPLKNRIPIRQQLQFTAFN